MTIVCFSFTMLAATADANWFLGTTAQVSGTLVAIIGGFLVSRVLTSAAERRALLLRVTDLDARAIVLRNEHTQVEADLLRNDWLPWFEKVAPTLAAARGQSTIHALVDEFPCEDRSADELRELFDDAEAEVADAVAEIETWFSPGQPPPPDLEEVVDLKSMPDVRRVAMWGAYIYLTNEFAGTESARDSMFLTIPFSAPEPPPLDAHIDSRNARRAKQDTAAALRTQFMLVEEQSRQARLAASSIDPREGAVVPTAVLTYLALAGVMVPLALMTLMRETLPATTAWAVFTAFVLGLAAMLAAIWSSLRRP